MKQPWTLVLPVFRQMMKHGFSTRRIDLFSLELQQVQFSASSQDNMWVMLKSNLQGRLILRNSGVCVGHAVAANVQKLESSPFQVTSVKVQKLRDMPGNV